MIKREKKHSIEDSEISLKQSEIGENPGNSTTSWEYEYEYEDEKYNEEGEIKEEDIRIVNG